MRLKLRRKVTIKGQTWTVRKVRGLFANQGCYGVCIFSKKEIQIDAALSRKWQEVTLLHELLHALWDAHLDGVVGDRTEEKIIEGLDEGLHALLKQL